MTVEKYLTYRGEIKAVVGVGGTLAFVTTHPEGQPTGLYRLDADALTLDLDPLPSGASALAADDPTLWAGGTDGRVYEVSVVGAAAKAIGPALDPPASALASLADGRLAVLTGSRVLVLARKDGKTLQTLDLPEPGTSLAVDPTGHWLAAGTAKGTVAVFDDEGKPGFLLSASEKLHEGAVSALLFEADDLRFFSAGADQKLFSTHARGKLEPEDKGRGNNHTDLVAALIWGPGDRLYSGGRDGAIKSWPRVGAVKPATVKDGVGRVVALALVHVHDRPRLAAACADNTIRFFALDAAGKIGDATHRTYDADERAKFELSQQDDPARRESALKALAGYNDARSIDLIADQVQADPDHALRLAATKLLGASDHPRALTRLESCLSHNDEAVRVSAFAGLSRQRGGSDLRPIDLALKAEKADVGKLAVGALEGLAAKDDQASARLTEALDAKTPEVRQAAVNALEAAFDAQSAEPNLVALGSKHADVRRSALVRLYRRQLLDDPAVSSALRRRSEDADAEVRRMAFLLSLHTRPRLLQALRSRDPELQRQLVELEGKTAAEETEKEKEKEKEKGKGKARKAKTEKPAEGEALEEGDREPLLQATAGRALDTCLRGARGLALLADPRAFGLLLQLSREQDPGARAEVCRALAALDDPRAVERLRSLLHDAAAEVRDAAFTALAGLHQADADPLLAAEAGLNASHEDVRSRGLKALTAEIRKAPESPAALRLLSRALNDGSPAVRAEAFKAALARPTAAGAAANLRIAAKSVHADIRRGVLTETMAQVGEPWGWDLLLEFFNDPDPAVRDEAFAFAVKKTKGLEFLEAGLGSRHSDLRKRSVDALVKKHTAASQALLVRAVGDVDREVRLAALESLVDAGALPALRGALDNPHADVRLRAAKALARRGEPAALGPLRALATAPEPVEDERKDDWLKLAASALEGLGELGDPAALPDVVPALDSPHAEIRKQAARALAWVCPAGATDALRLALQQSDPEVKHHAALGLAYAGDASVSSLVFSEAAGKVLSLGDRVAAAVVLGAAGEDRLVVSLDESSEKARGRALLALLMREWKDPQATPARCLACLSSRFPRFRLTAARALEVLADPAAFAAFITALVNDRGDKPAWKIAPATVDALAELLVHAGPQLRARTARLLRHLDVDEQDAFDQAWTVHATRFAGALADLRREAKARKPVPLQETAEGLRELAFGAYVGLVREQGGSSKKKADTGSDAQVVRVRQTALSRLLALAATDPRQAAAARPVFVQAMGDPNQVVRVQAFEQARAVGLADAALAAEALATGHTDLGVKGLELLTGGASEAEGRAVLERAMLTRKDDLAEEAGRLLIARSDASGVAARALDAAHEPLRTLAVSWLGGRYETDPAAREPLRKALGSRYRAVREAAAFELAGKKDPAAFDALVAILNAATLPVPQKRVAAALETMGDPRAPGALLGRVENDPGGTAAADDLLRAVGRFRRPEVVDRLLALWDSQPKRRDRVFETLVTISGFDQPIRDLDDERPDTDWEKEQFPRVDAVLGRLLDRVSAPAEVKYLGRLIPSARWARGKEVVDPILAGLVNHPDDDARHRVVEALGWRFRKRGGDAEPLRKALRHRDPVTQYHAAEGLARAGIDDGLNVLLAAVDFNTDLSVRRGAVEALGVLADERSLDALLKLAAEDAHALQESAAEAIGHMSRSPRAEDVFKILERYARGNSSVSESALRGLRWFNTRAGWQVVRSRAADPKSPYQETAVELLGYHDDPVTRDLLLKLLAGWDDVSGIETALTSARRLWGPDSLEPAYAVLKNPEANSADDFDEILARVRDQGEPKRVFEILPASADEVRAALSTGLLGRPELPVAEAKSALESPDATTAGVAAHILGRAGERTGSAAAGKALEAALTKWRAVCTEKRAAFEADSDLRESQGKPLAECLRALVWAAGRLGVARSALMEIAARDSDDGPEFRPIRLEAVLALAGGAMTDEVVSALESAARGGIPEVRAAAAQAIGRGAPGRAEAMAGSLLSDRVGFGRLTMGGGVDVVETLRTAARQVHYQGVVLPALIDHGDLATLAAVAEDRTLPEAARFGGIEGLAALASVPAEEILLRLGTNPDEDEELRRAALRGLKRSRRARRKVGVSS